MRLWVIDQIQRGPHTRFEREGDPCPLPLADYLFCEAFGFQVLPWELDDMPNDQFSFWQGLVATYRAEEERSHRAAAGRRKGR